MVISWADTQMIIIKDLYSSFKSLLLIRTASRFNMNLGVILLIFLNCNQRFSHHFRILDLHAKECKQRILTPRLIKSERFDDCWWKRDDKNVILALCCERKASQKLLTNLQTHAHFCFLFSPNTLFFIFLFIVFPSIASFLFGLLQT